MANQIAKTERIEVKLGKNHQSQMHDELSVFVGRLQFTPAITNLSIFTITLSLVRLFATMFSLPFNRSLPLFRSLRVFHCAPLPFLFAIFDGNSFSHLSSIVVDMFAIR